MSHDDNVRTLNKRFADAHRYANFGSALRTLEIHGFRGVSELSLTFESPITALSGLNGTGKSTIAQLAVCGYGPSGHRYYVRGFFPVSAADPKPFTDAAKVVYSYSVDQGTNLQQVTVSRKVKEWSGYQRQPDRECHYIGITSFIPKIERQDFSVYGGRTLQLGGSRTMSKIAADHISGILSLPYEHLEFTEVTHNQRSAELAMATRGGQRYSENHMGFGEGRVVYMVNSMEAAPPKSLFVLEEPETSLHGEAQHRLARYFVDVALRRGHQIIITTHSGAILEELGRESVQYLRRTPEGTLSVTPGLSTYQIDSYLLGEGRAKGAITICVEDTFARHFLIEIIRRCDSDLLAGCQIITIGGGQDIPPAVELLRRAGLRAAGILDGDMKQFESDFIICLPGDEAPEKEVFNNKAVKEYFASSYGVSVDDILAGVPNHHEYASAIAKRLMLEVSFVATEACRAYCNSHSPVDFKPITTMLREKLGDKR